MSKIEIQTLSHFTQDHSSHELALSVLEGLSRNPKSLPSSLFYDDKGSELFKKIMALPEYYPTNCEAEILDRQSSKIAGHMKDKTYNIVELGCGDGAKTILFFDHLIEASKKFNFVPLDISQAAIDFLIENLKAKYQDLPFQIHGLVAEYFQGLSWLSTNAQEQNMVLFLGSNIGNFNRPTSMRFLRSLWHSLKKDDLVLIGFDLKKDLDILYNAYNDSQGITKEFNFNVLDRINLSLGANFERKNFQHQGLYNVQTGAMESYLIVENAHEVLIEELGKSFQFKPWEAIHMEYSYKYLESDINSLAGNTGFEIVEHFYDSKGYFVDSLLKVVK